MSSTQWQTGVVNLRADLRLAFQERGTGPVTFLLLHGTGGNRSYMQPIGEFLSTRGRAITLDLRGHGESSRIPSGYSVADLSDDVRAFCTQLSIDNPVIVGHSLGAILALELASADYPAASAAVLLDAPILIPAAIGQALAPLGAAFRSEAYPQAVRQFATDFFFGEHDDRTRKDAILRELEAFPNTIFSDIWDSTGPYDAKPALARCTQPLLYIHASVPTDLNELQQSCATGILSVGRVVGTGHFLQLEVPEQVNAMIDRFIKVIARPAGQLV